MKEERCLDPQLWHACAGGMVQMPPARSRVYYFPQGHAEHANGGGGGSMAAELAAAVGPRPLPALVLCSLCSVAGVRFLADPETDEVFAKTKEERCLALAAGDACLNFADSAELLAVPAGSYRSLDEVRHAATEDFERCQALGGEVRRDWAPAVGDDGRYTGERIEAVMRVSLWAEPDRSDTVPVHELSGPTDGSWRTGLSGWVSVQEAAF